jgi:predicted ribosomally synthesized peptide with nif11-like leader
VSTTSKKGAKEFADLVDKDLKVREEVRAAAGAIIEVAKKHGFKFTGKEMQDHLKKRFGVKEPPTRPGEDPEYSDQDGIMTTWCW